MRAVATHCPYCALQCAQSLRVVAGCRAAGRGRGARLPDQPGRHVPEGLDLGRGAHRDRPPDHAARAAGRCGRSPRAPRAGHLGRGARPRAHPARARSRSEHGHDAVAVFGGGGLTNEKAYTLGKLARVVLRTPYIDYNGRFCMSSAAAAANRTLGVDRGLTFPLADLGGADAVLVVGSNPAATMPPLVQHLAGARSRGGLVVVDPRASATARLTDDGAGIHLAPVPGTDLVVLLALTHVLVDEGLVDDDVRRRPHHRLGRRARLGEPVVARARRGRVRHPRRHAARDRAAARGSGPGARRARRLRADRPRGRAVDPGHRRRLGGHQPGGRARAARPGGVRLRPAHRAGQRSGRPRARPEERPAARATG